MVKNDPARWLKYYDATAGRPPRPTLIRALAGFSPSSTQRHAVDLGSGDGRDTIELLRQGWSVLAIDAEPRGLERLRARPDLPATASLTCLCARFEAARWDAADLVNSSFALPFCPPERFADLWARISGSLKPGGRFAGQLFGERDQWAGRPGMTCLTRAAAERLLRDLVIEHFEEEETDGSTALGEPKHWHIFHVVARRD